MNATGEENSGASRPRILTRVEKFEHERGHCFRAALPPEFAAGDSNTDPHSSNLMLAENGVALGPGHAVHDVISERGRGLYSHWHRVLYFSSSDNSDPRQNGREYQVISPVRRSPAVQHCLNVLNGLSDQFSPSDAYAAVEQCLTRLYPAAKMGEDLKSFWHEASLLDIYRGLCGENYRSFERKFTVYNLARAVVRLGGSMAECGVYNAATAYFMALARDESGAQTDLFLFDSFEGLSAPSPIDGLYWRQGALTFPEQLARNNLCEFRNVHFCQGWIPGRFQEIAQRTFCFVHIDVDLYQPTRDSLAFFFPRLVPKGILVCDDYGFDSCPGARRAMDEFFADKPNSIVHLPTGQGVVIKC
jgi:hypothetical protein